MATRSPIGKPSKLDLSSAAMLSRFKLIRQHAMGQYWEEVEAAHRAVLNSPEREDELAQRTARAAFALRLFTAPELQSGAVIEFMRLRLAITFEQVAEGLSAFDEAKGSLADGRVSDGLRAVEFITDMFAAHWRTASEGPSADRVLNAVLGVEGSLFGAEKRRPTRGSFRPFEFDARKARQGAYLDLIENYELADLLIALLSSKIAGVVEQRSSDRTLPGTTEDRAAILIAESWFRLTRGRSRGMRDVLEWLSRAGFSERLAIQALVSTWDPSRGFDTHNRDANNWLGKLKKEVPADTSTLLTLDRRTKVVRQILCLDGAGDSESKTSTPTDSDDVGGSGRKTPTPAELRRLALIRDVESGQATAPSEPPR